MILNLKWGLVLVTTLLSAALNAKPDERHFPKNFKFGVATASYQIEGALNASGKGWTVWDYEAYAYPQKFAKGNGEIACDSYHKYKEDVQNVKKLGVDIYRLSIAWTRIMPQGLPDTIIQEGVDYYHNVIDELLANGIEPMITMFHWDLPEHIQNLGGMLNKNFVNYFADYADFLFKTYGYKVKYWTTFNEPSSIQYGYMGGSIFFPPNIKMSGTGDYLVGHNMLKAHAKVYHLYRDNYAYQRGNISINVDGRNCIPKTNSPEDAEAVKRCYAFGYDYFLHPIFSKEGDYSEILKTQVAKLSKEQGVPNRLPKFTKEEVEYIKGTADFVAFHAYTSSIVSSGRDPNAATPSIKQDSEYIESQDPNWPRAASNWIFVVPEGLRNASRWIKEAYNNPPSMITEFGYSDRYGDLLDDVRINYFSSYFEELKKAVLDDGCNVVGAIAWSLMDNYEWTDAYTEKFGLIYVDFDDPERTRTWKKSAHWFKNYVKENKE